jgi:hypothetical protein
MADWSLKKLGGVGLLIFFLLFGYIAGVVIMFFLGIICLAKDEYDACNGNEGSAIAMLILSILGAIFGCCVAACAYFFGLVAISTQ